MKDNDIILAIRYALRKEGISFFCADESGEYELCIEEEEADSVLPFVKCLLLELGHTQ